jgi:glycosyltransferase involved in cell wall biosynthesis
LSRTAYVSTYPPRRCGIATFTADLSLAAGSREIVALHRPTSDHEPYPAEVHHRIRRDNQPEYGTIAHTLGDCVDVVSIQHEYGIWGGEDGSYVLDFVRALRVASVATLHTVLRQPTQAQVDVVTGLISRVSATVVMSHAAADLLTSAYGVDPHAVEVIPHGVPNVPLVDAETIKPGLDLEGRQVILSFGLLGPGKGYEQVLEALPAVVAAHPSVCYVIAGATDPTLLEREGDVYRESLERRVAELKLGKHVRFHNRFMGRVELLRWLEAADVFVTPYRDQDKLVSGTLAYAMGAGRPIVSTPYAYASEALGGDCGVLVPTGDADAWAGALIALLSDDARRSDIGRRAYEKSRDMVWSNVAEEYRSLFARVAGGRARPARATTLAGVGA